jgi:hypothetical protein
MFKMLVLTALTGFSLAGSTLSFAQNDDPVTRMQVKAELVQLRRVGYTSNSLDYPANLQMAQKRVSAQNGIATASYGSSIGSTPASSAGDVAQP